MVAVQRPMAIDRTMSNGHRNPLSSVKDKTNVIFLFFHTLGPVGVGGARIVLLLNGSGNSRDVVKTKRPYNRCVIRVRRSNPLVQVLLGK